MSDKINGSRADLYGAAASTMCIMHCIATPFIFIVQSSHLQCNEVGPWWWHSLDFLFLILGVIAIYHSNQRSSLKWMPKFMYIIWFMLALFIVNAKASFIHLPATILYLPAISLIGLHLYNLNYSRSKD